MLMPTDKFDSDNFDDGNSVVDDSDVNEGCECNYLDGNDGDNGEDDDNVWRVIVNDCELIASEEEDDNDDGDCDADGCSV